MEKQKSRIFCMGDIHGAHKALVQCLERSSFDKENDTLIQLGDVVDGWSQVYECVEELLTIKHLIAIKGNHDDWFNDFLVYGGHPVRWLQGGEGTLKSYCENTGAFMDGSGHNGYKTSLCTAIIPKTHTDFFKNQKLYFRDHENRFFVHGGFDRNQFIDYIQATQAHEFYWDRDLWRQARSCSGDQKLRTAENFKEIFIGHTATVNDSVNERGMKDYKPVNSGGVYNLDQGAGWFGKLTIMDVNTKEYWQSDNVQDLYPEEKGRR